jgi:hypothetical protein
VTLAGIVHPMQPQLSLRRPSDAWLARAPGLRVAVAALLLAVVALVVAWAGASRAPVEADAASAESTGGDVR